MAMYQDAMDPQRVVKPLETKSSGRIVCRVYWRTKGGLNYGGKTTLPAALFSENPRNRFIGFYPV